VSNADVTERRIAWVLLIFCPLMMFAILAYVSAGNAPGLDAGHPMEYLQMTCLLWAMISVVIPLLRLMRFVSLPIWFVFLVQGDMFLYVISLCQGFYLNLSWWGDLTHIIASAIVTGFVFIALCLMQSRSPAHVTFGSKYGMTLMLFLVALSFGGVWEMMEGFTDVLTGTSYMVYGATDTLGDLVADFIGVSLMTVAALMILNRQGAENVASKVRLGRSMIPF